MCGTDLGGPYPQRQREGIEGLRRTKLTTQRENPEVDKLLDELANRLAHGSRVTLSEKTALLILLGDEAYSKGDFRTLKDLWKGIWYEDADWGLQLKKALVKRKERLRREMQKGGVSQ